MLLADLKHDYVQTFVRELSEDHGRGNRGRLRIAGKICSAPPLLRSKSRSRDFSSDTKASAISAPVVSLNSRTKVLHVIVLQIREQHSECGEMRRHGRDDQPRDGKFSRNGDRVQRAASAAGNKKRVARIVAPFLRTPLGRRATY